MNRALTLKRPLVVLDLETTGPDTANDRIVQLAAVKLLPDGTERRWETLLNPGMRIPAQATKIHGICDEEVANAPTFKDVAPRILVALQDCDLAGYNVRRFDIPLLIAEFKRAGLNASDLATRGIVDPMRIFYQREPRDLSAAHRFYLSEPLKGAHGAMADAEAAKRILLAQVARYEDLPTDVDSLSELCADGAVDLEGYLTRVDGEITLGFGKHKGTPLELVLEIDRGFLEWMLRSSFPSDVKAILRWVLETSQSKGAK